MNSKKNKIRSTDTTNRSTVSRTTELFFLALSLFPVLEGGEVSNPIPDSAALVRRRFHYYGTSKIPLNDTEVVFDI